MTDGSTPWIVYPQLKAQIWKWKERRGGGWSNTTYKGLFIVDEEKPLLVTRLSHGLRVIEVGDMDYYQFEILRNGVIIAPDFVAVIRRALAADKEFQHHLFVYEAAMGDHR